MSSGDDWRVTISLHDQEHAGRIRRVISEHQAEHDVRRRLGRDVAVSAADAQVFLYAGTEIAAREAEQVARDVLTRDGIQADFAVHRWHPIEEQWEDAGAALPRTEAERRAEHQRLEDSETAESLTTGIAQWQVRAELPSHRAAIALEHVLRDQGLSVVRRWKFLVTGANDSDDAERLAEQVRRAAPPGASVRAEQSGVTLPFIPF